jgi:hypothetical protein
MTNAEADSLIESLPKPGGSRLYREGDQIMMLAGERGYWDYSRTFSVPELNGEQLITAWKDFVEKQGFSLGSGYGRSEVPRDYQPGDKITLWAAGGWRPGTVVRTTPKRVLVEYSFKYDLEDARRTGQPPRRRQSWKDRADVKRS